MENTLVEIENQMATINAKIKVEKKRILVEAKCVILSHISQYDFSCDAYNSDYFGKGAIRFSCGMPEENGRYSFHSTFDMYFRDGKIEINCGTSGGYTYEESPEQVKRVFCIAEIWKNVHEIQRKLSNIDMSMYEKLLNEESKLYTEESKIKKDIEKVACEEIRKNLVVGKKYKCSDKMSNIYNFFSDRFENIDSFVVDKITDKFITLSVDNKYYTNSYQEKVRKDILVDRIFRGMVEEIK